MQELATIAKAAEARLLVVLAHVGGEVRDGDGADVRRCFDGPDGAGGRVRILPHEGLVAPGAFVRPVVARWHLSHCGVGCFRRAVMSSRRAEERFRISHGSSSSSSSSSRVGFEPIRSLGRVVGFGNVGGAVGGECGGGEVLRACLGAGVRGRGDDGGLSLAAFGPSAFV